MKELKEILTVDTKTRDLLILEVKPNSAIDLIRNGFSGNEKLFRLHIERRGGFYGDDKYYTPFFVNEGETVLRKGNTFHWGGLSVTVVSDEFRMQRDKIVAVAKSLGFDI